jgi:hypothetical protein
MLLLAQLVLAWHIPSHLHGHQHDAAVSLNADQPADGQQQDNEPCALGINGHGVALTSTPQSACSASSSQQLAGGSASAYPSIYTSSYQARGPPLHS